MGIISKPYTFSPNTVASSSEVNANYDTLYNEFNGSIEAANLATDAVTTAKVADSAIATAKIADSAVTGDKIADATVSSEKLNATIACRAYRNAAQSITSGAARKVNLDTENYDLGSDFDTGNSRFVAPVTGYYQVNATVAYTDLNSAGDQALIMIYVNGAEYSVGTTYIGATGNDPRTSISDLVPVTAGQYIELYTQCSTTESLNVGSSNTFMSIYFVGV